MEKGKLPPRWLREKRKETEREIIRLKEIEICRLENDLKELIERPNSDKSRMLRERYYEAKTSIKNMRETLKIFKKVMLDNPKSKQ